MARYETLFLAIPELTQDEFSSLESYIHKLIQEGKGNMLSFERWGKYKLAYPVRNNDYGIYGLVRFEVATEHNKALIDEVNNAFRVKFNDLIMRAMTHGLSDKQSLSYHRPESLEEGPVREVGAFMKENKEKGRRRHESGEEAEEVETSELEDTEQYMSTTETPAVSFAAESDKGN